MVAGYYKRNPRYKGNLREPSKNKPREQSGLLLRLVDMETPNIS